MRAKWFFMLRAKRVKVTLLLEEFDDGDFNVCKCKEFFYTHNGRYDLKVYCY